MQNLVKKSPMSNAPAKPHIAFFGTPEFAVIILEKLKAAGFIPELVVTTPDKPQGRHLKLTPSPVKVWATENNLEIFQPVSLKNEETQAKLKEKKWDLFIVAAYGKILPSAILDIPLYKTLNVHPSLLPKLRGSSPVESVILQDLKETGVTIIHLDEEMDHGPIIAQEKVTVIEWPPKGPDLEKILAEKGGELLARTIPDWIAGSITEQEQNHAEATYTEKITKEDGLIDPAKNSYSDFLKIKAYALWPKAYYFVERSGKKIRVVVTDATWDNGVLTITRVIPEGKSEISFADFSRSL